MLGKLFRTAAAVSAGMELVRMVRGRNVNGGSAARLLGSGMAAYGARRPMFSRTGLATWGAGMLLNRYMNKRAGYGQRAL